jgi:translation initiation factor IF-1
MLLLLLLLAAAPRPAPELRPDPGPRREAGADPRDAEATQPSTAVAAARSARLLALLADGEPTVEEVQRAAAARVRVDDGAMDSWERRARTSAWLPRLSLEYRHDERATRVVGLSGNVESDYVRLNPGDQVAVRAAWDLDRLVFAPEELRAAATAAQLVRRREEVVERATRLYFERRRLRLRLALSPPEGALERAEREIAIDAAGAELDALTGGLLSRGRGP